MTAGVTLGLACETAIADLRMLAPPSLKTWQGDFDGMLKRKLVRILLPTDRTAPFHRQGRDAWARGRTGAEFETWLSE